VPQVRLRVPLKLPTRAVCRQRLSQAQTSRKYPRSRNPCECTQSRRSRAGERVYFRNPSTRLQHDTRRCEIRAVVAVTYSPISVPNGFFQAQIPITTTFVWVCMFRVLPIQQVNKRMVHGLNLCNQRGDCASNCVCSSRALTPLKHARVCTKQRARFVAPQRTVSIFSVCALARL